MSALTPHLETKNWRVSLGSGSSRLSGLGDDREEIEEEDEEDEDEEEGAVEAEPRGGRKTKKTEPEQLSADKTGLTKLQWMRRHIELELTKATFSISDSGGEVVILVTPGVKKSVVPWFFLGAAASKFVLFSTNTKMLCATFDLPSGIAELGGSCPGAVFGQASVSTAHFKLDKGLVSASGKSALQHLQARRKQDWESAGFAGTPPAMRLIDTVCSSCVGGETLVAVRGVGLCRIDSLVDAGEFEVWSGVAWRKTTAVRTKHSQLLEVQFNGGRSIRCTADHQIITTSGPVEAQDLIVGEHQVEPVLPSESPFPKSTEQGGLLTVTAVQPCGDAVEPVYDLLDVGEEHQFLANGIPVHNCYAGKGSYGKASTQVAEMVRYAFVQACLKTAADTAMLRRLLVETIALTAPKNATDIKLFKRRFVRIHSSGDFFDTRYAQLWLDVAHDLAAREKEGRDEYPVSLWAPTRAHVLSAMVKFWQNADIPKNLTIRPSGYVIGDVAPWAFLNKPDGSTASPTGARGSTVLNSEETQTEKGKKFTFQCGVYALGAGEKNCNNAIGINGVKGCRACWQSPNESINYTWH